MSGVKNFITTVKPETLTNFYNNLEETGQFLTNTVSMATGVVIVCFFFRL